MEFVTSVFAANRADQHAMMDVRQGVLSQTVSLVIDPANGDDAAIFDFDSREAAITFFKKCLADLA